MFWQIAITLVVVLLALDLAVRLPLIRLAVGFFEQVPNFGVTPPAPDPQVETIEFPTTDGLTLRGSIHPARNDGPAEGVVLFCPELGGNQWMASEYCHAALENGWDVVAFDFRNQGASDALPGYEPIHWLTRYERDDVAAAIAWVRARPEYQNARLVLFGISRGGAAALAAAADDPSVERVVTDSSFSTDEMSFLYGLRWAILCIPQWMINLVPKWHLRQSMRWTRLYSRWRTGRPYLQLERLLPRLRGRPVLLIHGGRDSYVPQAVVEKMARLAGPSARAWIVPKARHNGARRLDPEAYDQQVAGFLSGDAPATRAVPEYQQAPS